MLLMVSSQTVAAETCTPWAEVIACRAREPRRGLSSSSHSRAWLSRSSIVVARRAVEHLLDVRIKVERLVAIDDLALHAAERRRLRRVRHQAGDGGARLRDHAALPRRNLFEQPG